MTSIQKKTEWNSGWKKFIKQMIKERNIKSKKGYLHDGKSACRRFCFLLRIGLRNTGHLEYKILSNKKTTTKMII